MKDEKGDLVADCHSILGSWRNHFSQLFHVHEVKEIRQTEIQTAEPPVPEPSDLEVDLAIVKLKRHKSPGTDRIPAELIKQARRTIHWRSTNLLNLLGIRRNCFRSAVLN